MKVTELLSGGAEIQEGVCLTLKLLTFFMVREGTPNTEQDTLQGEMEGK